MALKFKHLSLIWISRAGINFQHKSFKQRNLSRTGSKHRIFVNTTFSLFNVCFEQCVHYLYQQPIFCNAFLAHPAILPLWPGAHPAQIDAMPQTVVTIPIRPQGTSFLFVEAATRFKMHSNKALSSCDKALQIS